MKYEIGQRIWTDRFMNVRIAAIFADRAEAEACGYTEPTHSAYEDVVVLGKSIDMYHMIFAIAPKQ